jgi:hypothetical protein
LDEELEEPSTIEKLTKNTMVNQVGNAIVRADNLRLLVALGL